MTGFLFKVERADTGEYYGLFHNKGNAKVWIMTHYHAVDMVVRRGPDHKRGETGATRELSEANPTGHYYGRGEYSAAVRRRMRQ